MLLAYTLGPLGRTDEAIDNAQKALKLSPGNAEWHYATALLYLEKGARTDAITHLEAALRANPGFMEAQQTLASLRK